MVGEKSKKNGVKKNEEGNFEKIVINRNSVLNDGKMSLHN